MSFEKTIGLIKFKVLVALVGVLSLVTTVYIKPFAIYEAFIIAHLDDIIFNFNYKI
jgi:hypothetical protein